MTAGARIVLGCLALAIPVLTQAVSASSSGIATASMAPEFAATDIEGAPLTLSGYRGKLVLLNFWATWCGPCLTEMPGLVALQNTYGAAGLRIVGISMDDESAPVKRAYKKYHLNYPVVMGSAALAERFGGVLGLPLSYLIGADGRVIGRYQGEPNLAKLEAQIKSRLTRQ